MKAHPFLKEGTVDWVCDNCKRVHKLKAKAEDCCRFDVRKEGKNVVSNS